MSKYIVLITILYVTDCLQFFKSGALLSICFYGIILLGTLSLGRELFIKKKLSKLTFALILYCFLFPLYGSYKSSIIFEQPIFMGIVSLRYLWVILFGFFLYSIKYDYRLLLLQINNINICIAIVSIIAFFFFGINHVTIEPYLFSTDSVEITSTEDSIKGAKLFTGSAMMLISYIYYLLKFMDNPNDKKIFIPFIILMVYLIFVNKGRQPLALVGIIYFIYYIRMKRLTIKRFVLGLSPIVIFIAIILYDSSFLERFFSIFEGIKTSDNSTLARLNSIESVIPYIIDNPVLGFGNLSYKFREFGFHAFFGYQFYLADIGVFGTIARGGIVLLTIYFGLYYYAYKRTKAMDNIEYRKYMRYMIVSFLVMLIFLSNDTLFSTNCIRFAFVFYPLFSTSNNINIFFKKA